MVNARFSSENLTAAFIILCGLAMRLFHLYGTGWIAPDGSHLLGMRLSTHSLLHFSDADYYDLIVRGILEGRGFNIPFPPPFTVWVLAGFYKLWGYDPFAAKIFFAFLDTAALFFIWRIAREVFGATVGLLTLFLSAFSFTLIFITGALNTEPVYLFTLALAVWLFVILYNRSGRPGVWPVAFGFGLASAAALLTRSEYALMLLAFMAIGLARGSLSRQEKAVITSWAVAGFLLVVTPWTVRNYHFMTTFNKTLPQAGLPVFVPGALNGPFNFYQGHNPTATGGYAPGMAGGAGKADFFHLDPRNPRHLEMVRDGYKLGFKYLATHPGQELAMLPRKAGIFLSGLGNGLYLTNLPHGLQGRVPNKADSFVSGGWIWPTMLGVLFLAGCRRIATRREGGPLALVPFIPLGAGLFACLAFFALSRLAFPLLPFVYMVAAAGAVRLWESSGWPYFTRALQVTAVVFLLAGVWYVSDLTVLEKGESGSLGGYRVTPAKQAP